MGAAKWIGGIIGFMAGCLKYHAWSSGRSVCEYVIYRG